MSGTQGADAQGPLSNVSERLNVPACIQRALLTLGLLGKRAESGLPRAWLSQEALAQGGDSGRQNDGELDESRQWRVFSGDARK